MKLALFHNFTFESFTGYWDGRPKTFKAGEKVMMPQELAEHYAKHLVNAVLISRGHYNYTSPKFPKQVPMFMELFNQACIVDKSAEEKTESEVQIAVANQQTEVDQKLNKKEPQVIIPPDADEDEESEADKEGFKK
jgi:hypothetical protein